MWCSGSNLQACGSRSNYSGAASIGRKKSQYLYDCRSCMFPPLALHTSLYTDVASVTAGVPHFRHIRCTQKRIIHLVQCLVILLFLCGKQICLDTFCRMHRNY